MVIHKGSAEMACLTSGIMFVTKNNARVGADGSEVEYENMNPYALRLPALK